MQSVGVTGRSGDAAGSHRPGGVGLHSSARLPEAVPLVGACPCLGVVLPDLRDVGAAHFDIEL